MSRTLLLALALLIASPTPAAVRPRRSELRKILNALRAPVEKELKPPVLFKVDHIRTHDGWAFMTGVPQRPGGKAVDYRRTRYAQQVKDGAFDDWICALLRKRNGRWAVVRYAIGATDVVWDGWDREHKAPRAIFPYPK